MFTDLTGHEFRVLLCLMPCPFVLCEVTSQDDQLRQDRREIFFPRLPRVHADLGHADLCAGLSGH